MLNGSSPTVVVAGVDRGGASVPVWDLIYFWITRSCEEPWFTTICYLTGGRLPVFCRGGFCSKGSRNLEEFQVSSRVFKILNICFDCHDSKCEKLFSNLWTNLIRIFFFKRWFWFPKHKWPSIFFLYIFLSYQLWWSFNCVDWK